MRNLLLALPALLWFASACQTPPEGEANPADPTEAVVRSGAEVAALDFGWPDDFEATVTTTKSRKRNAGKVKQRSATSRYTLRVSPAGDDLHIHFENPTFDMGGQMHRLPAAAQARTLAQLSDLIPDYLVTRSGEFVSLRDLPGYQMRLRAFLERELPKDVDSAVLAKIMGMLTSEVFLNSQAAEQWNSIVGAWAGAELELGAVYGYESREPIPLIPGQEIQMNYQFVATRWLPCERNGGEQRCVELQMIATADPADTQSVIQAFIAELGDEQLAATPLLRELTVENTFRVITEPDGMFPHDLVIKKHINGLIEVEGEVQKIEQLDRTQVSYAYP